jgi:hypothetical protein
MSPRNSRPRRKVSSFDAARLAQQKQKTRRKNTALRRILREVGITKPMTTRFDVETASRFVAEAKRVYGPHPNLISLQQTSILLGISVFPLNTLIRNGKLKHVKLEFGSKKSIYFDMQTLADELRSPKVKAFLIAQTVGRNGAIIKKRANLVKKIQQNAERLVKE